MSYFVIDGDHRSILLSLLAIGRVYVISVCRVGMYIVSYLRYGCHSHMSSRVCTSAFFILYVYSLSCHSVRSELPCFLSFKLIDIVECLCRPYLVGYGRQPAGPFLEGLGMG